MTDDLNIFNPQSQSAIFDDTDSVNWLDMYTCDDSCADGLIENITCDGIDSFSFYSSYSPSFVTHAFDPT